MEVVSRATTQQHLVSSIFITKFKVILFLSVELTDMEKSAPHSFAINLPDPKNANDNKVTSLILSSSTQNQRSKWVSDIELASNRLKQITDPFYSTATGQPSQTCKFCPGISEI